MCKHNALSKHNFYHVLARKYCWGENTSQYVWLKSERAQSAARGCTSGFSLPLFSSSSTSHSSSLSLFLLADRKPTINVPTCCIWVRMCCNCSVSENHFPLYLHFLGISYKFIIRVRHYNTNYGADNIFWPVLYCASLLFFFNFFIFL